MSNRDVIGKQCVVCAVAGLFAVFILLVSSLVGVEVDIKAWILLDFAMFLNMGLAVWNYRRKGV